MSREKYDLLDGALLISDAHFGASRPQLLSLLKAVETGSLDVPQLILLGDIFDLLFGEISVTHDMNREAIGVLKNIRRQMPVLYLEGNHDYNLASLFPDVHVVPLRLQPFACRCGTLNVQLAHGDFNQPLTYRVYTALIRNRAVLHVLGLLNRLIGNKIIDRLERYLEGKNDCHVIPEFERFVHQHLSRLDPASTDVFIEGHYHQGRQFGVHGVQYFNPSAFACNRHYAIVRYDRNGFTLEERVWEGR